MAVPRRNREIVEPDVDVLGAGAFCTTVLTPLPVTVREKFLGYDRSVGDAVAPTPGWQDRRERTWRHALTGSYAVELRPV